MTYSQNPPDGTQRQPSFTPHPPGQQPYQPQPAAWPAPYQQAPQGYGYTPGGPPPRRKRHILRNVLAGIGGVVVAVIVIAVIADAGGTHTVTTTGSSSPAATAAKGARSHTAVAQIGSTISLAGNNSGEKTGVTVVKVLQHPAGADEFSTPPAGDRFYAVQFRLADTGTAAYSDSPSNGAVVVDSAGQSYESDPMSDVAGCQGFASSENIAPGSSGLGCVVFDVPVRAKITLAQFTLDSGFGPQTGQWNVAPRS